MLVLACVPVLVAVAMIVARRPALHAAACGVVVAVVISCAWFPIATDRWSGLVVEWLPVLLEVLVIIAGGLALSEANQVTGRQQQLACWLEHALGAGTGAALAVVHGVTPFAESVTGFGIGVTVAIPLLLHLGFDSRKAATIGLLGLCAVPWGSMGPGTLIAATLAQVGFDDLGVASAVVSGPVFLLVGLAVAWMTSQPGCRARALLGAVASAATLWAAITAANMLVGTAPAGAVGALVTLGAHLTFHRLRRRTVCTGDGTESDAADHPGGGRVVVSALAGYAVLMGGVLAVTVVLAVTGLAATSWRYAASPAVWLLITVAVTTPRGVMRPVIRAAGRKWMGAGPVTGLFVLLGITMAASGMSATLARGIASVGSGYGIALPFVAALGGYLTGSNSAANAMFAAPQAQIIGALGLPRLPAMAVHNVASSLLLMGSPAKVELAAQLCPDTQTARSAGTKVLLVDITIVAALAAILALI